MQGFMGFHAIAAARGDGLHPQLLALAARNTLPANVVDLSAVRPPVRVQSGPAAALPARLPDNVVRFGARPAQPPVAPSPESPRRPRVSRARSLSRKQS